MHGVTLRMLVYLQPPALLGDKDGDGDGDTQGQVWQIFTSLFMSCHTPSLNGAVWHVFQFLGNFSKKYMKIVRALEWE